MVYDSILFDVDGVILQWPEEHPQVYRPGVEAAFDEFDVSPSSAELDTFLTGTATEMAAVCARHGIEFESFWPRREAHVSDLQCAMMDRGERTLYEDTATIESLTDRHRLGLVSNNQHETISHMVDRFGLGDWFETVYGRTPTVEGFRRTKPDPYYLDQAVSDLDTTDGLYVGDSACDVEVAQTLGLDSVFLRRPHRTDYELAMEPTYELTTLDTLTSLPGVDVSAV